MIITISNAAVNYLTQPSNLTHPCGNHMTQYLQFHWLFYYNYQNVIIPNIVVTKA